MDVSERYNDFFGYGAEHVTPTHSARRGLLTTTAIGLAAGVPCAFAVDWISDYAAAAAFVGVTLTVMLGLLYDAYDPKNEVPIAHEGIATKLGDKPTGEFLDPGIHPKIKGIGGVIPVDKRLRKLDVPEFVDLANDILPVLVNAFVFVETVDSLKSFTVVEADQDLINQCDGQARLFTNQMAKAEYATRLKDELAEYLSLPSWNDDPWAHDRFRNKLLTDEENGRIIPRGADTIMEEAGDLAELASGWGMRVKEVRVKDFDLNPEFKQAQIKKAETAALMASQKEQNTAAAVMVKELVDAGVDPNNASNTVDMRMGLNVHKNVDQSVFGFQNFEPNLVISAVAKPIAEAFARWLSPGSSTSPPRGFQPRSTTINRPSRK
jgi:hypothetical protein